MNEPLLNTITILHFDDEIEGVTPIAVSVLGAFLLKAPSWVIEEEVNYGEFEISFVLHRLELQKKLKLIFRYVEKESKCIEGIDCLTPSDISFFDLMREDSEGVITLVGVELFRKAIERKLPRERIFVLTGFPDKLAEYEAIEAKQKLVKPISASEVAVKIINLLPPEFHPDRAK